jgi:MFS family permease
MLGFIIIVIGQSISILATGMVGFALTLHVFNETGSALSLGLMQTFYIAPLLIFSPIAGAMVDLMMVSDFAAGLGTVAILILYTTGLLEIWHFYIVNIFIGIGTAFQYPAINSVISTIIPKEQYGRANALLSLAGSGPSVVSPLLAGALLPLIGLINILIIDVASFVIAIGAISLVFIPQPERTVEGEEGKGNLLKESAYGFRYIFQRRSLLYLQILLLLGNTFLQFRHNLIAPMILTLTNHDSLAYGSIQSAGALAVVAGGIIMSAWKGFKRRINGVLIGWGMFLLFGAALFGLGRGLEVWIATTVLGSMMTVLGSTSANAIWQTKVAPDVQGRVFAARRLIPWIPLTTMPIIVGYLADNVMEPAMRIDSGLSRAFSWLVGTGPGTGMSLLIIFGGLGGFLTLMAGFLIPALRNVEDILPDHDEIEKVKDTLSDQIVDISSHAPKEVVPSEDEPTEEVEVAAD